MDKVIKIIRSEPELIKFFKTKLQTYDLAASISFLEDKIEMIIIDLKASDETRSDYLDLKKRLKKLRKKHEDKIL